MKLGHKSPRLAAYSRPIAPGSLYSGAKNSVVNMHTGIIRSVLDVPILPDDPTIFACTALTCDPSRFRPGMQAFPGNGAGFSREQARSAAIGEAIERYCSGFADPESLIFGTYKEVCQTHPTIHPSAYALFLPSQYSGLSLQPFNENTPIAWVSGNSLKTGAPVLVPAGLVYLPYHPWFQGEGFIAEPTSNGLACGDSYEEAVFKGLCEVVERDAFMIMWLNRQVNQPLSLRSFPPQPVFGPFIAALQRKYTHRLGFGKLTQDWGASSGARWVGLLAVPSLVSR